MSIAETLGTPVTDAGDYGPPTVPSCRTPDVPVEPASVDTPSSHRRIVAAGLAIVAGLAIGIFVLQRPTSSAAGAMATPPTEVGPFAEFIVSLQLSGATPPAELAVLSPSHDQSAGPTGIWVNHAAAISVEPLADSQWVAIVATDVLEIDGETYQSSGIHYYEVVIDTSGPTPSAMTAPARIPPPSAAGYVDVDSFGATPPQAQAVVAAGFLEGLLTGSGEAARYLSAGSSLDFFEVPPYASVRIVALYADRQGAIRARVEATSSSGAIALLDYVLRMTVEDDTWVVADVGLGAAS